MAVKFSNNAAGVLASSINGSATSVSLASGQGALFPSLSGGEFFYATLVDPSNNLEIVKVTARTADTLTVVRGQDGTSARSYAAGDKFELRVVAAAFDTMVQTDNTQTISGVKTFSGNNTFSGVQTFSQTIVGSINGNAATVTNGVYTTGNQTIAGTKTFDNTSRFNYGVHIGSSEVYVYEGSTNALTIRTGASGSYKYVGVAANGDMTIQGSFTASGNVTAYSDERLKKDWAPVGVDFVSHLAQVKSGTYTRIDNDLRQAGVSAQSLQAVLPETVQEDVEGTLSVAYGNAALVAAVELAKKVVELQARLEVLEGK